MSGLKGNSAEQAKAAGGCVLILFGVAVALLLRGVVLRDLWEWFVFPLGVPLISMWHAIGLSIIVAMLTRETRPKGDELPDSIVATIFATLTAWGVGWLFHWIGG